MTLHTDHCRRSISAHPFGICLSVVATVFSGCGEGETDKPDAALTVPGDDAAATDPTDTSTADATNTADSSVDPKQDDVAVATDSGPCIKDCTGKVCGPNGCGGVCGFCVTGQFCAEDGSKCTEFCKPDCKFSDGTVKKCGDDGCGGSCGTCPAKFSCGLDDLCHAEDCKPACGAKKCGDDGCGGLCGTCAAGDLCQPDGSCKPGPCKGIPAEGQCDGDVLVTCIGEGQNAQKSAVDCSTKGPKIICGWNAPAGAFGCIDKPPCTPDCSTKDGGKKQCGSDGCDGVCGVCPKGWSCPANVCQAEDGGDCGFLPPQGQCDGKTWIFCNTGKIKKIDCGKYNQTCGYQDGKFTCK